MELNRRLSIRIPLLCAVVMFCGGCTGWMVRRPVTPPGSVTQPVPAQSPTTVVPRSEPVPVQRPIMPNPVTPGPVTPVLPEQDFDATDGEVLPRESVPSQSGSTPTYEPVLPDWLTDPGDAPNWRPSDSPNLQPAPNDPTEINLGAPSAYPRPPLSATRESGNGTLLASAETENVSRRSTSARQVAPANPSASVWSPLVRTRSGQTVQFAHIGQGPKRVLIVGSVSGNESHAIELMDAVLELTAKYPPPQDMSLILIRTLNPDGQANHIRTNGSGVDLNRNFPTEKFTSSPTRLTGARPASEPEIQALLSLIKDAPPACIVHLCQGAGERSLFYTNRYWPQGRESAVPESGILARFENEMKAGSIEEYSTLALQRSFATVQLATTQQPSLTASEFVHFATSGIPPHTIQKPETKDPFTAQAESPSRHVAPTPSGSMSPESGTTEPATLASDGERGDVEFLPSPFEFTPDSDVASSQAAADRYQELPKPPGY